MNFVTFEDIQMEVVSFILSVGLWPLAIMYLTWGLFVLIMGLRRAQLAGRLSLTNKILGAPYVAAGLIGDVISNVFFSIPFRELPKEWLLTKRLQRYKATENPDTRRYRWADWICNHLDVFDPTGDHC